MRRQGGFISFDIGGMLIATVIATALVSAPLGWLSIEGLIWLWKHVSISWGAK